MGWGGGVVRVVGSGVVLVLGCAGVGICKRGVHHRCTAVLLRIEFEVCTQEKHTVDI